MAEGSGNCQNGYQKHQNGYGRRWYRPLLITVTMMGKCWPYELILMNKRLTVQYSTGLVLAGRQKGQKVLCLRPWWALRATASCIGNGGDSNRCQPVAGMSWGHPDM